MGKIIEEIKSVETEQEALRTLFAASCAVRHDLDTISSGLSVSRSQMGVLYILKEAYPEGCSRGQIIDGLVEACPDVTRLIDGLEKHGLVERYRCEHDARVSIAKSTENGIQKYAEAQGFYQDYLEKLGQKLTKEEWEALTAFCEKIYAEDK